MVVQEWLLVSGYIDLGRWEVEVGTELLGTVYCVFSIVVAFVLRGTADDDVAPFCTDDALLFAEVVALVVDCLWFSLFSLFTNADDAEVAGVVVASLPLLNSLFDCAAFGLRMEK